MEKEMDFSATHRDTIDCMKHASQRSADLRRLMNQKKNRCSYLSWTSWFIFYYTFNKQLVQRSLAMVDIVTRYGGIL